MRTLTHAQTHTHTPMYTKHTFIHQFLNRSVARSSDAVNTLASFGLAYVFVKFFVGVLDEMKQVGLVLVHDRIAYRKVLLYSTFQGICVAVFLVLLGEFALYTVSISNSYVSNPCSSRL